MSTGSRGPTAKPKLSVLGSHSGTDDVVGPDHAELEDGSAQGRSSAPGSSLGLSLARSNLVQLVRSVPALRPRAITLPNLVSPLGRALDNALGGRRHRRVWAARGRAHVEVKGIHRPDKAHVAADVEKALRLIEGVNWAEVNVVTGRVAVLFDPEGVELDDILDAIDEVEEAHELKQESFPLDRPEHPGDIEPLRRNAIALAADIAGLGVSVLTSMAPAALVPSEVVTVVSLAENQPRVRHFLERHIGFAGTDLGLGLTNAMAQALAGGPLGLVVDITSRINTVSELASARRTWERREPHLVTTRNDVPLEALEHVARPSPLPQGPLERYGDLAALGSMASFAATLALTRSPRRAAGSFAASLPKAARQSREAFASHLGRELARRDVVVLDRQVLRRLDRLDVVVLDLAAVTTGRVELGPACALGAPTTSGRAMTDDDVVERAVAMFDPQWPDQAQRQGDWTLCPLRSMPAGVRRPRGTTTRARTLGEGRVEVLGLARADELVGLVVTVHQLDPLAASLAARVKDHGHLLVVAGSRGATAARLHADRVMAGGRRLADSVRFLQAQGHGVLLVAAAPAHAALVAADCGVGVPRPGHRPPWGADMITRPGLADAHLVVEALSVARQTSKRGSFIAAAGSAVAGAWSALGPASSAGRRAALPVNAAALVAQGDALLCAERLRRRPRPVPAEGTQWHAMGADDVLRSLGSSREGISEQEAARRKVARPVEPGGLEIFAKSLASELANPLTPMLVAGAGLAAAVGSVTDAALVAGVTGANALLGATQRVRSELSVRRLLDRATSPLSVRRSGRDMALEPEELVRGDVVELFAGDLVPADCRILEAESCEVDESVLTGEPFPVPKHAAPVPGAAVADRACMLFEGTTVSTGRALAVVVAVGDQTEVGRSIAGAPEPPQSGVEARLAKLAAMTGPATLLSGAAVTGFGLLRGRSLRTTVTSGVGIMVAAVPEGLPVLAAVAQHAAAARLSERGALVRNPRTIEALGRVDTLCFDKTGTLTAGHIELQVVSDGSSASANIKQRAVLAAALRASPLPDSDGELLHATDRAVVEGAVRAGVTPGDGLGGWKLLGELAFDPVRGYHAVIGSSPSGHRVSVKGAPEAILARCDTWLCPQGPVSLDDRARDHLHEVVETMAGQGLRVLAVAERECSARADIEDERVVGMQLLGFLGLADSVRPTAAAALGRLADAGVDIVMITGDHPATAKAVARELGIINGHCVLTGPELDAMGDHGLDEVVRDVAVFARVTPAHKVRIVRAYQRVGKVVAMTGDGANDAPAIRLANTGVALGGAGSPAASHAADLVVTDDRIETIVDAIVEGRAMWASVRDALAILVGGNLGEVAFSVATAGITGSSALGARQFLLVNLLTDMLPATTIAMRPPADLSAETLLQEGPDASLGAPLARQIALRAATTAAGATGAWMVARATGRARRASTIALAALVGTQLGQTALTGRRSPLVLGSMAVSGAVLVGVVQTPGVSQFFGCTPLGPVGWSIALGSAALATAASVALPELVVRALPSRDRVG